ncbi:hypothetical protein QYE76_021495 [Lolium multiflorum]|uniref:Retrotransposon gag domain-containing protein n=1 Tax=Lolium multiflorum TaxID=4521 RepID=A0AAD8VT41_LOLMU|nr:hypothetical protein QYE76_021495 [Lolium multiflorum]
MDACAYLEEPIVMTFGEFRFGVNKEGSYRLEVPISSEFSAVDSNFSSSDEEFSSPYFVDSKASEKLAKIFSNTSFESSADSFISSDSDSVDSFDFIDKSASIGKVFTTLYGGVTNPDKNQCTKYHQIYVIEGAGRSEPETSEAFDELGNPYVDPADLRHGLGTKYVGSSPRERVQLPQEAWDRAAKAMDGSEPMTTTATAQELQAYQYRLARLPENFKKFDGLQDPEDWLVDYLEMVKLVGGTRATAMQSIQVHLSGAARSWIKKLPLNSIDSWDNFEDIFVKNFRSTCKKPASLEELRACRQKHDESMRKYIQRWNIIKNSAEDISDERAIDAFVAGVRRADFIEDLGRTNPKTISALMEIANKWADGEDAIYNKRHRNPSKEIFSELDETFAQGPIFARSFQKTEDLTKWGHEEARGVDGAAQALAAPTYPSLVWPPR